MRLYIIRHADPDYENGTITLEGHQEANALSKRLKNEGINKIFTSPMGRAMDTMRYTADILNLEPSIQDWTHEIEDGWIDIEPYGKTVFWNIDGATIKNESALLNSESWSDAEYLKGNANILSLHQQIWKSSDNFIKSLGYERVGGKYRCVNPNRDRVAVFCHGGLALAWIAHLLEIPPPLLWSGLWLPPSSVTTVLFDERTDEWAVPRCLGIGDVSHLYSANLPVSPRGIINNFY